MSGRRLGPPAGWRWLGGAARAAALTALAKQVDGYASGARDAARVRTMSSEIKRLAAASK